jgi:hypothetical protein
MGIIWNKSGLVEMHNGAAAGGAQAFFYEGGITTPKVVYEDSAETTAHEDAVTADANGRWPEVHIPFGSYGVKVTTSGGTQLYYHTNIPNADPVEAAASSVEDYELYETGDWKITTDTGDREGYVRANARTIGNSASGATERANDDTEDLFTFLWNKHANGILAVSGGRGASAAADFAANKTIALPNFRNATFVGAGDMGNSDLGLGYGGSFTTGNATTPGSVGGANTHTLTESEIVAHQHTGTTQTEGAHTHAISITSGAGSAHSHAISIISDPGSAHSHAVTGTTGTESATHTHALTTNKAFVNVQTGTGASALLDQAGSANLGTSGNASVTHTHDFAVTSATEAAHTHVVSGTSATESAHTHLVSGTSAAGSAHSHTFTTNATGGSGAHNNMQRHVVVTAYIRL